MSIFKALSHQGLIDSDLKYDSLEDVLLEADIKAWRYSHRALQTERNKFVFDSFLDLINLGIGIAANWQERAVMVDYYKYQAIRDKIASLQEEEKINAELEEAIEEISNDWGNPKETLDAQPKEEWNYLKEHLPSTITSLNNAECISQEDLEELNNALSNVISNLSHDSFKNLEIEDQDGLKEGLYDLQEHLGEEPWDPANWTDSEISNLSQTLNKVIDKLNLLEERAEGIEVIENYLSTDNSSRIEKLEKKLPEKTDDDKKDYLEAWHEGDQTSFEEIKTFDPSNLDELLATNTHLTNLKISTDVFSTIKFIGDAIYTFRTMDDRVDADSDGFVGSVKDMVLALNKAGLETHIDWTSEGKERVKVSERSKTQNNEVEINLHYKYPESKKFLKFIPYQMIKDKLKISKEERKTIINPPSKKDQSTQTKQNDSSVANLQKDIKKGQQPVENRLDSKENEDVKIDDVNVNVPNEKDPVIQPSTTKGAKSNKK